MKKAVIIHCWGGAPDTNWYRSVQKELEQIEFEVVIPAMPETDTPKLEKWLPVLRKVAGKANENLYLIGHSVGCITILRYLEGLSDNMQVGGVVLVAGFTDSLSDVSAVTEEDPNVLPPFFVDKINWDYIKKRAKYFVAIHSDNDPYIDLKHADIFKEKLGAGIIIKNKMGHFSEIDGVPNASCKELSDVTEAIKGML